ncbi:DEAD/DEAH box helicase [Streptomyces sp. NBC_01255]|uniref:DEAD/DEAH box helicase n=1 Tax=Streptomyces sp. NBC_01255 TaxID=2903798 RepID=UPI002E3323BE|nr:DEAD/DEAH box helicase [Streptomyces sp. NBC_01255]
MTLPVALTGTDVIGQAKTGTGKTLGFGLPILERVTVPADVEAGRAKPEQLTDAPQALVVVPTRELCQQVTNDLLTAGKVRNVRVLAIYGGRAYEPQVEALKKGVDVIVGTPGRLLDLAGQRKLDLSHVKVLVLDEADEMLDLGFLPDVEKIMNMLPAKRQTMLFSATMPGAVISLARRYMSQPTHIRATSPDGEGATVANIKQHVYRAHNMDKPEMVSRILQANGRGLAMIFCRTKRTAADIAEQLERRGFASGAVHGDLGQGAREQALRAFRNGKVDVLVCTDVAARGIDVEGVTHVINYQSPEDEKTFLHRVGRTGRAGAKGTAVTLVDWDDIPRWQLINKALELDFHDPAETYSSSPHLYEELDIPAGTKGILPRTERTRAGLGAEELEDLGEPGGRRGRAPKADKVEKAEEFPARTRTPRQRRRTRGGSDAGDAPVSTAPATAVSAAPAAPVSEDAPAESGPRTPRRRRRTRPGNPGTAQTAPVTAQPVQAAPVVQAAPAAPVVEAAPAPVAEEPKAPRRRARAARPEAVTAAFVAPAPVAQEAAPAPRRRRPRVLRPVEDTVSFQTVETAAAALRNAPVAEAPAAPVVEAPVEAPAEPKKAPRRRTAKKAVAEPVVEAVAAPVVEAVTVTAEVTAEVPAPRRRRAVRKATGSPVAAEAPVAEAPVAEPVAEPVVEEAPKAPRARRTARRPAGSPVTAEAPVAEAPVAEPVVAPVVEEAPKAPRARRTARRPAGSPVTTEAPVTVIEAPVAEPAAVPVVEKVAEPVVEEAPKAAKAPRARRTTKKAAAAEVVVEAVEAPVAEEAPKAPRRRATKKAVAAEAPDASEPKTPTRRRTTKKAAAAAEAPAVEAAVAEEAPKAPRRRTTKKAAAAQPES